MLLTALFKKLCPDRPALRKTARMMKIVTLFLLASCLQLSARTAAQSISLALNNATLSTAFAEIQRQSDYRFVYTNEQLAGASRVSIKVESATLEKVLELCFRDQLLEYTIEDKFIVVKSKEKKPISFTTTDHEIRGTVSNEKGEPIGGASVRVQADQKGTATNGKGEFMLADVISGSVIIVSSIGYETREIVVGNNRTLSIQLLTAVSALDEMVIKGYYTTSKRLNTGAVSKIGADEIERQPVSNVLAAAAGRMPGVYIQQANGMPGSSYTIQIRGQNSLRNLFRNNGNLPLYIIDGVPFSATPLGTSFTSGITQGGNPLSNINPSDIESLEVLKDADATAIYGSRGANGVIVITTKKGRAGDIEVQANAYYGVGKITRRMDLLNTAQYLQMRKEAFRNDGAAPNPSADFDVTSWDSTKYTDWQKELLGNSAVISNAEVSVSGGNANTQFLAGGAYHRESTVFPGSFADKKSSFHFNLSSSSNNKRLNVSLSASYMADQNNLMQTDLTTAALRLIPNAPAAFTNDGQLNWQPGFSNPYAVLRQRYKGLTSSLIGNLVAGYQLAKGLTAKTNLGYTNATIDERNIVPLSSFNPANGSTSGYTYFGNTSVRSWIVEPQLEYGINIFNGRLKTLLGASFNEQKRFLQVIDAENFTQDNLLENLAAARSLFVVDGDNTVYHYQSLFLHINYDYKSKYLLNLTGRRDGSSRFGPGKQYGNFGAAGVGWIFTKEKFFQALPFLSFGKIRGSYGITGSDQIGDYKYLNTWAPTTYAYQVGGLYPTGLANDDYSWETNKKLELALELGFVKDRVLFSISYYRNRSSNQLVGYSLPSTTGFSTVQANLPAVVMNKGWEFELNAKLLNKPQFSWSASLNLTVPTNILLSYPGIENSSYANSFEVGNSLFVQKKFHYTGVNPQTGLHEYVDIKNKSITSNPSYPEDLQAQRSITQQYYGGMNHSLVFKGWQLDIFLQFVKQTGANFWSTAPVPGMRFNQPEVVLGRWQKPGDQTTIQQFTQKTSSAAYAAYNITDSDYYLVDASFVRLKNLSISYHLPEKVQRGLHLKAGSVFVRGQNLFTITNYLGLDPENQSTSHLPPLRVLTGGISITL